MSQNDSRDPIIFCAAELPPAATSIPSRVTARSIFNESAAKIPNGSVIRVLSANDDRIRDGSLFGQIDAIRIRARSNDHLIAWLGRFDFCVGITRSDVDNRRRTAEEGENRYSHAQALYASHAQKLASLVPLGRTDRWQPSPELTRIWAWDLGVSCLLSRHVQAGGFV